MAELLQDLSSVKITFSGRFAVKHDWTGLRVPKESSFEIYPMDGDGNVWVKRNEEWPETVQLIVLIVSTPYGNTREMKEYGITLLSVFPEYVPRNRSRDNTWRYLYGRSQQNLNCSRLQSHTSADGIRRIALTTLNFFSHGPNIYRYS